MNRFHSNLKFTLLCAMLIGLLAACNGSAGGRNTNSSIDSQQPAATSTARPSSIKTSAAPALPPANKPTEAQPGIQVAPTAADAAPQGPAVSAGAQSDAQADEIDRALNDLTNQLNSLDTLDDLK